MSGRVRVRRYPRAMHDVNATTGKADAALDQRLSDELDKFNGAATLASLQPCSRPLSVSHSSTGGSIE